MIEDDRLAAGGSPRRHSGRSVPRDEEDWVWIEEESLDIFSGSVIRIHIPAYRVVIRTEANRMKNSDLNRIDKQICGSVWTSDHIQCLRDQICNDIGPRPTGSKSYREALEIIASALRRAGATKVRAETIPVFGWDHGPSELRLTSPRRRVFNSVQHVHTTSADVSGPLVNVPVVSERELDLHARKIDGAVVLASGPGFEPAKHYPLSLRVRDIAKRGAIGVVTYNAQPAMGPSQHHLGVDDDVPIPAVGVSNDDGLELVNLTSRSKPKVKISVSGRSRKTKCANLVGEVAPSRRTNEDIVLNAHLDCLPITPGALDNLSGVLTLVEIVRALAPHRSKFRRRLRLLIPTGEEYGLVGSAQYVKQHHDELDDICFDFSLDTLCPGTSRGIAVMWAPEMRDMIERTMRGTGRHCKVQNLYCAGSDYLPFMMSGIAAARAADWENSLPRWCHTTMDNAHNLPVEWIQLNAMPFAQLLLRLLTEPRPLPTKRKSRDQVAALMAAEGEERYMKFLNVW